MIKDVLKLTLEIRRRLEAAGIESAGFEARQLVKEFYDDADAGLTALEDAVCRREKREPLQYIIGEWEFYGLPFFVGPGVLIPRADTEILADLAIEHICTLKKSDASVADLCSGSGALAVAIAHNCPGAGVTAVELSNEAFHYLEKNISRNGVSVNAILGDALKHEGQYDLIVTNPPYIKSADILALEPELAHEPKLALDGGEDGLIFYRALARRATALLKRGGVIMAEIGFDEGAEVTEIFTSCGLQNVYCKKDYSGNDRVVCGTLP